MKTYTIIENVINYKPAEENGVKHFKPTSTEEISKMQAYTAQAMKYISLNADSISPASLWFDDKGRVRCCKIYLPISDLRAKEILITRNV